MSPAIRTVFPPSFYNNQQWSTRSFASRYAASYWEGAVRFNQGNELNGYAAIPESFSNFVCSFWSTNLYVPAGTPAGNLKNYCVFIAAEGGFDTTFTAACPFLIGNFVIEIQSTGNLSLYFLDSTSTSLVGFYHACPNVMGATYGTIQPIIPAGVWHHYIISFEGATNRTQIACDRGGGPAWGGGIMDSALGALSLPPVTFHTGTAPQKMWGGATLGTPTSFSNTASTVWRIQAPTSSLIDLAYFYMGTSENFFDLTVPGNLDYFITSALTPVNLGIAGSNVPLTCLIMHTGNAFIPFAGFLANPYSASVIYTIGDTVSFNGSNYTSLIVDNLNNRPDTSPTAWLLLNSVLQFYYNAATGRLWGGDTIENAPTQPLTGA